MKRAAFCALLFAVFFAAVSGLMPFHDDWSYSTAPNPDFAWTQLLPSPAFWRPFDVAWGALMAKWPALFPVANRFVIVLAHAVGVYFAGGIFGKLHGDRTCALFEKLQTERLDYSKPIYFVVDDDRTIRYYSVFSHSAAHGLDCGRACRAFNGWHDFDYHFAYTMEERVAIPYGAQVVHIK